MSYPHIPSVSPYPLFPKMLDCVKFEASTEMSRSEIIGTIHSKEK